MNVNVALWNFQERLMNHKPNDYRGTQFDWELNVIYWILDVKKALENNIIDIQLIENIVKKIERHGGHSSMVEY